MNKRQGNGQLILLISLQALAVIMICLGSLINFHQYKIWGKPLIHEFVGYKRDHEKNLKQGPVFTDHSPGFGDQPVAIIAEPLNYYGTLADGPQTVTRVPLPVSPACIPLFALASCGLRAPPAA